MLSGRYFLNHRTFCYQIWYGDAASWASVMLTFCCGCYLQGQGHSKSSYDQNITLSAVYYYSGCLSLKVWWLRTRSTGLAILLSARSYSRLSWELCLHPLHLLWPVLLRCCWLQLTSISSMIQSLQYNCSLHFFVKDGVVILYVCLGTIQYRWICIGLVIVQLIVVFCPSDQYLSFFCESSS